MKKSVKNIIFEAIDRMLIKNSDEVKIRELVKKHSSKVHFIPQRYRIFGGLLQSLNIQFGNFIEELMRVFIENEDNYEIITEYSGKKMNNFYLSKENDNLIDKYITDCQIGNVKCDKDFVKLQKSIVLNKGSKGNIFKHDIDLLFKNKKTDIIYYVEIKYNDDHDTGKFVDINRKFIKTYAYLVDELKIENVKKLQPILFYFNNKIMKGNIYLPENSNIYRGKKFFDTFLSIKYEEVDKKLMELSESEELIKKFDDLYNVVMNL